MNILGFEISRKAATTISIDTLIKRLEAAYETASGVQVTPENCMQSPTVQAIVTRVSRSIETLPVHVFKKSVKDGRNVVERQANHPIERLLSRPNDWQTSSSYWLDATSWLIRYGNHYAFKSRGQTGPIRKLIPMPAGNVDVKQRADLTVYYEATMEDGSRKEFTTSQIHHARGPARNGVKGDSPVVDVREAIALEIAAEKMGAAVFGNGAMPGLIFEFMEGSQGFKTDEERNQFIEDFQEAYSKKGRMKAMLMPKGIKMGQQLTVENEKAQFLETRKNQRSVIAGAFGVPPHLVGDLERATFSNIEQQSLEFVQSVVLPYARIFETAMERDLLTDDDRAGGIIIRFNLDGILRGDFKSRQEGLNLQRMAGVINANDWREQENMNPIPKEDGGEAYYQQGPSGQNAPGTEKPPKDKTDGTAS